MANKKVMVNVDLDFTTNKTSIEEIRKQMDLAFRAIKISLDGSEYNKTKEQLKELQRIAELSFNPNTGKVNLRKMDIFTRNSDEIQSLQELGKTLKQNGVDGSKSFTDITNANKHMQKSLVASNGLLDKMGTTLMNTIRWNISSTVISSFTSEIQKGYYFAKDLDRSLTHIQMVSGLSANEMARFAKAANAASKELKISTIEYANAAQIFFQQGLNSIEAQRMADATIIGSNITGESAEEISNLLTGVVNGYQVASENVLQVTDKLAAVGASTAADFYELATAMFKVASMAQAAGVPIDVLNAQIATIVSVTKESPESIGTSLKTIYGRMLAFKADTKALMEDEDGEMFGAPAVEEALQAYSRATGAQISLFETLSDGTQQLRNMSDVLADVGESWDKTSDNVAKFGVATALAGTRQQNRLVALFNSWDKYKDAVEVSLNSEGTSLKQNEIYLESYQGKLKGLQAAKESLYMTFVDMEMGGLKTFVEALTTGVNMMAKLSELTGGFSALLGIASATLLKMNVTKFTNFKFPEGESRKSELKLVRELQQVEKAFGTERAESFRKEINMSQDRLYQAKKLRDELAEQASRYEEVVRHQENLRLLGKSDNSLASIKANAEGDEAQLKLIEDMTLAFKQLRVAEEEILELRTRPGNEDLSKELEKASLKAEELRNEIKQTGKEINKAWGDAISAAKIAEEQNEKTKSSYKGIVEEAKKVNRNVDLVRTTMTLLPTAFSLARDETKEWSDVVKGVGAMTATFIPRMVMDITSATKAGISLGAAFLGVGAPILAITAAVGLLGVAINAAVKYANRLQIALDKAAEAKEKYESVKSDRDGTLEELDLIKERLIEIAELEEGLTAETEKEKGILEEKQRQLEVELAIKELLLQEEKDRLLVATKLAMEQTKASKFAKEEVKIQGTTRTGSISANVTNLEELKLATKAYKDLEKEIENLNNTTDEAGKETDKYREKFQDLERQKKEALEAMTEELQVVRNQKDTFDSAGESIDDYLAGTTDAIKAAEGLVLAEAEKIKVIEKATDKTNELTQAIKEEDKITKAMNKTYKDIYKEIMDVADGHDILIKAMEELNKEGQITRSTLEKLIEYDEKYIEVLGLEKGAIEKVLQAHIDKNNGSIEAMIKEQQAVINTTQAKLDSYGAELMALDALLRKKKQLAKIDPREGLVFIHDPLSRETGLLDDTVDEWRKIIEEAQAKIDMYKGGIKLINQSASSAARATSEEAAQRDKDYLDTLDAEIRAIKTKNDWLEQIAKSLNEELALAKKLEGMEGLEEQYRITGEIIANNTLLLESFKEEQNLVHQKANEIREAHSQYDTEAWFDKNAEATQKFGDLQNEIIDKINKTKDDTVKKKLEEELKLISDLFSQIQRLKKSWMESATEIEKANKATMDLRETQEDLLKQQRELLRTNWVKARNQEYKDQQDRIKALQQIEDKLVQIIRKRGEAEKKALDEAHKAEIDSLEKRHQERSKKYQEEADAFRKMIQDKIDALTEQHEEEDYIEALNKEKDRASELQRQIDVLSLDDSLTARNQVIKLRKELAEQNEKIAKMQQERERKLLKDSLQDQLKNREQDFKDREDIANNLYENEKKRLEEEYRINKEFLEQKYSDEKVYAEARESIMKGQVEVSRGVFKDIYDAFSDFEDKFGRGMGILGDIIKNDFIAQLELAQRAIKEMDYLSKNLKPQYDSSYDPGDEVLGWNSSAPKPYVPDYGYGAAKGQAARDNEHRLNTDPKYRASEIERTEKVIRDRLAAGRDVSVQEKYLKRLISGSYKHGGIITDTGVTLNEFHGTQANPEWIFNNDQLKKILQDTVSTAIKISSVTPKIPSSIMNNNTGTFNIEKLIEINGNVDEKAMPDLKRAGNDIADVIKGLNKGGVFRPIKR